MVNNALFLSALGFLPMAFAQEQVQEAPPPPVLLSTIKSGVIPELPTQTPFAGVDTLQGAIISPLPPQPGYTGLEGTATAQSNQPSATYRADLPDTMFNPLVGTVIQGSLEAVGGPDGVTFTVNITNLPDLAQYGPFNWHIHTLAVPEDGNCTATTSHFDPTNRGELIMCEAARPETCQVGDLAGKHGGKISTPDTFTTTFVDPYLSVVEGSPGFFGSLGFVLHSGNTTRLTCANFELVSGGNGTTGGNGTSGGTATGTMAMPTPTSTMPSEFTGAAAKAGAAIGALGLGLLAVLTL